MGTADVAADRIADAQVDTWRVATWAVPITRLNPPPLTQRNPMWLVAVSWACGERAAGR